jgi:ACS family hexuronate transporter-like MFS transporter
MSSIPAAPAAATNVTAGPGYPAKRWAVLFLLFLSIAINLLDRQVLSVLAPVIREDLDLTATQYSNILVAFLLGLTIFQFPVGWLLDRFGVRYGLPALMTVWSIANGLHAAARNLIHLSVFRFVLGAGECGNYSAGIKTISMWFPPRERALAGGIFNGGTVIGAFVAPAVIVAVNAYFGWRMAFLIPSVLGLLWIIPWLSVYRDRAPESTVRLAAESRAAPPKRQPNTHKSFLQLLAVRQVWGAILIRAFGGPVVHFYWYWLPEYLTKERGFSMTEVGMTAGIPFLFAGIGNIAGGWFSGHLMTRGITTDWARKSAFLLSALLCGASILVPLAPNAVSAMALICTATFGIAISVPTHIATLTDLFPADVLARLAGLTGLGEGIVNIVLQRTTRPSPMFRIAPVASIVTVTSRFISFLSI